MSKTKVLKVRRKKGASRKILEAAGMLRSGNLVAFPTETVYGLGANALDRKAVRKIFRAKGRPANDPLIVHVASEAQVYTLVKGVPLSAKLLMEKFWPGPLTIVLRKSKAVPREVTAGLGTVAVRMPGNPIALALISAAGIPVAAPSANLFGKPSPTRARDVLDDLDGRISVLIDGGRTRIGIESTVIDMSGKTPVLLRPGNVTLEELESAIGKVKVHPLVRKNPGKNAGNAATRSPGMAYRHYAPLAEVVLVEGKAAKVREKIGALAKAMKGRAVVIRTAGKGKNEIAAGLFRLFREADRKGAQAIIVEGIDEKGLGLAVMNRIRRAAKRIVRV
ncbi:MAG: threonylcarbamoyl-AMP synthase [Candidatus Diapherotrites archaeon]|uniref:Threonylcarbamoyl-AMP synthase n=1 Tax=Candidatus Iainarchaeum sp. TaxID=3101447 RepID=A0A8T3YN93_9ARCH|nr:threonylcarbamoyl-AMP synthase [Candidatus Diapherotrites archaeon]